MKRKIVMMSLALASLSGQGAVTYVYGADAEFAYELMRSSGGRPEQGVENGETFSRILASNLFCQRFTGESDGVSINAYRCELNMNGEREPYVIGGLYGGQRLFDFIRQRIGAAPHPFESGRVYPHVSVRRFWCVKVNADMPFPTFACGINP